MKLCCRSLFRRVQHVPDGTEVVGQMGEARQRTRQALLVPVFVASLSAFIQAWPCSLSSRLSSFHCASSTV